MKLASKTSERRRRCWFVWLALLFLDSAHAAPRAERERGCESCHQQIAAEWRASFHRQAYSDPAFAAALSREPRRFCRGCHAPEASARTPATGWAAQSGIACVTCHLRGEQIRSGPGSGRAAPHPVTHEPNFATAVCVACHEFEFPDDRSRLRRELMQSTISEHRALASESGCGDCHMPQQRGHRSHRFAGGHDADFVRSALTVRAQRAGRSLAVTLTPIGVGHALPTGDLFRRMVVEAVGAGADGEPVRVVRTLQRHFAAEQQLPGAWVLVTAHDDRLRAPQVVQLELAAMSQSRPVRWRVRYQRVAHPVAGTQPDAAVLDGEIIVAAGVLATPVPTRARPQPAGKDVPHG